LFGEKYGDVVRMVDIGGPWSRELCAGTHVQRSSQIGVINLVGETSVSAGARRVEALVGMDAVSEFSKERELVHRLQHTLKTKRDDIPARIDDLIEQVRNLEKTITLLRQQGNASVGDDLVHKARTIGQVRAVVERLDAGLDADEVRSVAQQVLSKLGNDAAVVALAIENDGRGTILVMCNQEAIGLGANAGAMVKDAVAILGGGGGGKPNLAQGGGPDGAKLPAAIESLEVALNQL